MFLVVCATEFELQPLLDAYPSDRKEWATLVTGVGMVETALCLTRFLEQQGERIHGVLNIGVGGAYIHEGKGGAGLLEICLAVEEIFGDFGLCHPDRIEPLAEHIVYRSHYLLDSSLLEQAATIFKKNGLSVTRGKFVTVCGVSATASRGTMLVKQYDALCENMEGAAVARVCEAYGLPLLEMRTISNFVEDRDCNRWKLSEACEQAGKAAAILLKGLINE
ncbi:MAG: futalosine hydrolase [Desulfocapsa sp.]|nr:futalosine hydrolase [Desulfocapsa sp.]